MATAELIVEREQQETQLWRLPAQIPELDGIRGLAILLVLICHSAIWLPESALRSVLVQGKVGVDLFFVLSGFLITGILLDAQFEWHALRNFYVRRALRIWPLYFLFLFVAFAGLRRMTPSGISPWVYLLFAQNFFYVAHTGPLLDPLWSLAVEEQFYVLWPWVALRVRRETVFKICWAVVAVSPVIRCGVRAGGFGEEFIYANTLCRLDGIAMGGMLAAWVRGRQFRVERLKSFGMRAIVAGAMGTALCFVSGARLPIGTDLRYSFIAITFGGVVAITLALQGGMSWFARTLRSFGLAGLGRISFALYLFNLPVYTFLHGNWWGRVLGHAPGPVAGLLRVVLGNALLLVIAACSWRFFESRILRLKARVAPREINGTE